MFVTDDEYLIEALEFVKKLIYFELILLRRNP